MTYIFSHQDYASFLSNGLLQKQRMESSQQNISKSIEARALKLDEWICSEK